MNTNKIDINDITKDIFDVNNALIGLRQYALDRFTGISEVKIENLDGLNGLIEAVLSLSEKSVNRIENINLIK